MDPGHSTLRVLVAEVAGDQATIWGWHERPGAADAQHLADIFEEALRSAEEMARDRAGRWLMPDQMLVGLPASLLRGGAGPVTQRRPRSDRPVEEAELATLLSRGLRLAVNRQLGSALLDAEAEDPDWLLLDAAPVTLTVDGRGVTDPVGFRGRELGATVFAALAQIETVAAWRDLAGCLSFSALTLAAAPLAVAAGLADAQCMLVDVGGVTTDLTWCQAGRPVALASVARGSIDLTRALLRQWRISPDRAERLKHAYAASELDDAAKEQVLDVLGPTLQAWLEETEAALVELNHDAALPAQLYLLGGGSALPEMADVVRALAWSRHLRFARYPKVDRLEPTDVPGVVNRTEFGRGPGDVTALALAAWAALQSRPPDRATRIFELSHRF